jgi:ABC-2 type transport system ATP-binding protein
MSLRLELSAIGLRRGARMVLEHVDLQLAAGELVGLIGPNGSGKSSLLRVAAGLLPPSRGQYRVDGLDPRSDSLAARARIGYSIEPELLPAALRGRQCLELVAHSRGLPASALVPAYELCEALGLAPWLEAEVGEYSLGTRQKLAVALALLGAPPLLLLDEVLNGLDPLAAYALKQALRERADRGAAVLLATHGLEVAERFLDRAVLLLDGRIAADWDRNALQALRADGGGLEAAVVARLRAARG